MVTSVMYCTGEYFKSPKSTSFQGQIMQEEDDYVEHYDESNANMADRMKM